MLLDVFFGGGSSTGTCYLLLFWVMKEDSKGQRSQVHCLELPLRIYLAIVIECYCSGWRGSTSGWLNVHKYMISPVVKPISNITQAWDIHLGWQQNISQFGFGGAVSWKHFFSGLLMKLEKVWLSQGYICKRQCSGDHTWFEVWDTHKHPSVLSLSEKGKL